jgi:hypothetical protein
VRISTGAPAPIAHAITAAQWRPDFMAPALGMLQPLPVTERLKLA